MSDRTPVRPMLLALIVALILGGSAAQARTVAVVIGIDKYDSPDITPLTAAVKDARTFGEALKSAAGAAEEDIKLLTSEDTVFAHRPTKANIVLNLKWAQRATTPEDIFIIYYAGHGITRWGTIPCA